MRAPRSRTDHLALRRCASASSTSTSCPGPGATTASTGCCTTRSSRSRSPTASGSTTVWEVEHHFLEEYSHSSASDVFLAAASQRTQRIRLGLGILPLPLGYQHPARVAETVVDARPGLRRPRGVRHGRDVERRRARGLRRRPRDEARAVGGEPRRRHAHVRRGAVRRHRRPLCRRCPQRNVVPKPHQKPHPPLWVACSRRETIRLAAEKGIGALSFSFVEPEEARRVGRRVPRDHRLRALRAGRVRGQPAGRRGPADDVPSGRGRGDRARHRRRALLRLLARALLRLRRSPAGADEHLRGVPAPPRRGRLRART